MKIRSSQDMLTVLELSIYFEQKKGVVAVSNTSLP